MTSPATNALTLSCQSLGDATGAPLVVLHGLFGSGTNWRALARHWSERFTVHLVDARNHGNSPHAPTMNYDDMADDVEQLVRELAPDGAHLLGHSMGGKTAMRVALRGRMAVHSLLVADVAPVSYGHNFNEELAAMKGLELASIKRRSDAETAMAAVVPEAGVRAFLLQNLVLRDGAFHWRINLDAIGNAVSDLTDFPAIDGQYEGATTVMRGELSSYVQDSHISAIERLFPAASMITIPEAGHWLHAEQPQRFADAVDAHFDSA